MNWPWNLGRNDGRESCERFALRTRGRTRPGRVHTNVAAIAEGPHRPTPSFGGPWSGSASLRHRATAPPRGSKRRAHARRTATAAPEAAARVFTALATRAWQTIAIICHGPDHAPPRSAPSGADFT